MEATSRPAVPGSAEVSGATEQARQHVVVAAARVGGIHANNTFRAEFLYDNLMIEANLIHGAHKVGTGRHLPKINAASAR
mgnify:CR=1 FL=1